MVKGKSKFFAVLLCIAFCGWYVLLPIPLGREVVMRPVWAVSLDIQAPSPAIESASDNGAWFRVGRIFGYVNQQGEILSIDTVLHNVTLSDSGFINYTKISENCFLYDPYGRLKMGFSVQGYPVLNENGTRLFVFKTDLSGVQELSPTGERIWERDFGSLITTIAVNDDILVAGLLNGTVELIDTRGTVQITFTLQESRIPVILGCDITDDSRYIGVVSGHDPQKVTIFERETQNQKDTGGYYSYTNRIQQILETDFRREVMLHFVSGGSFLFVEGNDRAYVIDTQTGSTSSVLLDGQLTHLAGSERARVASMISGGDERNQLYVYAATDHLLLKELLPAGNVFIRQMYDRILLGSSGNLLRIDMQEG